MHQKYRRHRSLFSSPVPKEIEKPKMRWKIWPILWTAFRRTCMVLGATVLFIAVLTLWTASSLMQEVEPQKLPDEMVLYLELDGKLKDLSDDVNFVDPFASTGPTMRDFIDALDHARSDPRVQGIYARLEDSGYALAHIQEMRAAIERFRKSGKFAYIYSTSYGLGGMSEYYLASAFDEIWMQPVGLVAITGVNAETPFFRDVLDKVGVEPQFFQRKEFKTAYESLNNSHMSDANREMMTKIIDDISQTLYADLARERSIPAADFKKLVDKGVFMADEAVKAGLVDESGYADQLVKKINEEVTGDPEDETLAYVHFVDYMRDSRNSAKSNPAQILLHKKENSSGKKRVALIYAVGVIMPRDTNAGAPSALFDDGIAAADEIAQAIIDAAYDRSIGAIVLRVDSPGGSPEASETILRAVEIAQEKGKSVTVSMGPTAASGGYWIAAYADRIFALPTTLTGSIGVLGGKISMQGLWEKLGVNWERISRGRNAAMWSSNTPFSESEAERMNAMLDNIYDNFLARVAKGRKMSVEDVDKIAHGRVWTGTSAAKIGLVDELGGLDEALDYAAQQAGAKDRYAADIVIMPKPLNPFEQLVKLLENQVRAGEMSGVQAGMIEAVRPLLQDLAVLATPRDYTVYNKIEIR